jgi:hypothetical protein
MGGDMAPTPPELRSTPRFEPTSLNREQLYELVWSEPVARVAERYGLSGTGLRKLCLRNGIPVPPRGHWAKVAAGRATERPPLPSKAQQQHLPSTNATALKPRHPTPGASHPQAPEVIERVAYETDPRNKIRINHRRTTSSSWATALRNAAEQAFHNQRGLLKMELEQYGISATVAQKSVSRLAHVLAALELASETRGFLQAGRRLTHATQLIVDGVALHLHFAEQTTRHEVRRETRKPGNSSWWGEQRIYRYEATGMLTLAVTSRGKTSWYYLPSSQLVRDTAERPLEERLNDAMVVLHRYAAEVRRREVEHQQREERQRAAEEAARIADSARQRRQIEIQTLIDLTDRWRHAESIRAFIEASGAAGRVPGGQGARFSLADWRIWALAIADQIDPLTDPEGNPVPTSSRP